MRSGKSRSLDLSRRRAIKEVVVFVGVYHASQLCTKFYPTIYCQG